MCRVCYTSLKKQHFRDYGQNPVNLAVRSPVHLGLQQRYHGVHLNDVLPQSSAYPLCERRGGRPGLPVPNSPHGLCGRK